jgi:ABC-2 type transport system permease protein
MIGRLLVINLKAVAAAMFSGVRSPKKRSLPGSALRKAGIAVAVIYLAAAEGVFFYNIFAALRDVIFMVGAGWLYFAINAFLVLSLCVVTCIFAAQSQVFDARDNGLLLSMPIRPSAILAARILTLLVPEYFFEAMVSVPALIVWVSGGYASAAGIAFFAAGFVLLPLLALAVSCLLAWLLTLLTSRLNNKTPVSVVVSLVFCAAYFWVAANARGYVSGLLENGGAGAAALGRAFPPLYFYGESIASGSFAGAALFALCAVAPFALCIALLSANFIKTVTSKRGAKKREYRERAPKASPVLAALVRREFSRYLSNAMFILNMSLGGLFALAGGVAFAVRRDAAAGLLESLAARLELLSAVAEIPAARGFQSLLSSPGLLLSFALLLVSSTSCASAALISLEGKTLWILRGAPVRARDVLLSKVCFHMLISALPVAAASLLGAFALFPKDARAAALAVTLPFLFTLLTALAGLHLNLLMPRFDWINELWPLKHGIPVLLVTLGSLAVLAGAALIYILLLWRHMGAMAFGWAFAGALAAADALLCARLVSGGARRFDAFEA